MFSKLDEASLEDTPENRPIKALIRRDYMMVMGGSAILGVFIVLVMLPLLRHFEFSTLYQMISIPWAYMTWRAFKPLRVNTSAAVIGVALGTAVFLVAIVAIAFFQASSWLFFIAGLLFSIIACFTTQKTPQGFGFNLFTGSALGIFGDFEDDQSLGRRLTRTELLSFAQFLGGLWLVQDYKWRADGISLLLPAMLKYTMTAGSKVAITWDGNITATMSSKDMKVTRQLLVGRNVEAAELQENACRVVRYALNCFLRGDSEAARKVLSPNETFVKGSTSIRHDRVKSLVMVFLWIVMLVALYLAPSAKEKELHHWVGAYYALIVAAAGFLIAMIAMAITLHINKRQNRSTQD